MPPQFQVLRCYKCSVFQGHQTTKSNKWECKVCGEKQSFKRFYGLGTAKDCRLQVQKLNGLRGQLEDTKNNNIDENGNSYKSEEIVTEPVKKIYKPVLNSKWSNYVDETETVEENANEDVPLDRTQVNFQIPTKRRKQSPNNFKRNPGLTSKEGNNDRNSTASPTIVPSSLMFSKLIQPKSKPSQPNFNFGDSIPGEEPLNINKHNKFVSPVSNKNSKWAQFTEEPQEKHQTNSSLTQTPQNDMLFSWSSDDADLESILDI